MASSLVPQPSFSAGIVSPEVIGRIDLAWVQSALTTSKNFIIRQYGGAETRPGLQLIAEASSDTGTSRLISFERSIIQTYALEFADGYARVVKDGVLVTEAAKVVTGATQANPCVVTSAAHGYSNGDRVVIAGVVGMTELNGRTFVVAGVAANTFQLRDVDGATGINSTGYTAYVSGGTVARVYQFATPWAEEDLANLVTTQDKDVMTVCHPGYYPRDITCAGHTAWSVSLFDNQGGPFKDVNTTATTVYASGLSGAVTLTASAALFDATMVGELFYIEQKPDDATPRWEVNAGIDDGDIRRAGTHYYEADIGTKSATITAVIGTAKALQIGATHTFQNGDTVRVTNSGVSLMDDHYFRVANVAGGSLYLRDFNDNDISTTGWPAWPGVSGTLTLAGYTGTIKPSVVEGTEKDGDKGVTWRYLHSGFGIAKITAYTDSTHVTATVINRLPEGVVGAGGATVNWARAAWGVAEGYPQAVGYSGQRLMFGGTQGQPNTLWASGVNTRKAFTKSNPLLNDEGMTITLDARQVNAIRHILPLSELIVLTNSSEIVVKGQGGNALLVTETPLTKVQGFIGSDVVPPIVIGNLALYVEEGGSTVRTIGYDFGTDSYTGNDLSARVPHLFQKSSITSWAYHNRPYSLIWAVMDDGSMNGLTFMREHQVMAWHTHETDGAFQSNCVVREGKESAAYFIVKRVVNGKTRRFIERLHSRLYDELREVFCVDSGLTFDGRNTGSTTMTVSGGTTWDYPESMTLTASAAFFTPAMVGGAIVFWDDKTAYRLEILAYTSSTVVTVQPNRLLPLAYRTTARSDWEYAPLVVSGLWHLEGAEVSILADGNVVNPMTVANGKITLPLPAGVVHVGLGYECLLESLDITSIRAPGDVRGRTMNINRVNVLFKDTRGAKVGCASDALTEVANDDEDLSDAAPRLFSGLKEVNVDGRWEKSKRVIVKQSYPLPATVLSLHPEVSGGA